MGTKGPVTFKCPRRLAEAKAQILLSLNGPTKVGP